MSEQPILWWLAHNTLFAAFLAVIVYLACRHLRLRPAVRHLLWLLVLVKLATPPILTWPWSPDWPTRLAVSQEPSNSASYALLENTNVGLYESKQLLNESRGKFLPSNTSLAKEEFLIVPGSTGLAHSETYEKSGAALPPPDLFPWPVSKMATWGLAGAWVLAGLGMMGLQLLRVFRFNRMVAHARSASGALVDHVSVLAKQLGLPVPRVLLSSDIASPMVWGLGRPTLLWPASLVGRLSAKCQQAVIVHELAHLRRRDHWVGWLQLVAGCVWWWHPLYRYVSRQVRANAELACDAWVVNLLPTARRAYADALLEVSQLISRKTEPLPVMGMAAGRVELERRLIMIMRDSVPCRLSLRTLLVLGILALVVLPGWSLSQQSDEKNGADRKVEKKGDDNKTDIKDLTELLAITQKDEVGLSEILADFVIAQDGKPVEGKDADRLDRLEKQLEAMRKEVQALRAGKKQMGNFGQSKPAPTMKDGPKQEKLSGDPQDVREVYQYKTWNAQANSADDQPIIFSRATYKMAHAKAEALAAFLRDQLKNQSLEAKVEDDSIVITTLPDMQLTISQFIALVQGKAIVLDTKNIDKPVHK
jgi:bla regulator protein BlaR1